MSGGSGRLSGTLGSLVVDCKGAPLGVGSGLSDELRGAIWADPASYIGRVIRVRCFEETHGTDGAPSLRFPAFAGLREAGKLESYA